MTSHQAARTLVERMDAKGLLVVASSDSDGRAKSISLSGSGRDMCAEIRRMGGDTASHALSALSPEDRAVLRELLGKISSNLP